MYVLFVDALWRSLNTGGSAVACQIDDPRSRDSQDISFVHHFVQHTESDCLNLSTKLWR